MKTNIVKEAYQHGRDAGGEETCEAIAKDVENKIYALELRYKQFEAKNDVKGCDLTDARIRELREIKQLLKSEELSK